MNYMRKSLKACNGITLIALVITIIVLLILAGISISMLSGDNSILQKATTAKENTERAEIVENAKIDVLNEITENKGNNLQESQLKSVLENYFIKSEIPEELPSDLSTLELTTLNNKYKIKISEIYDGTFKTSPKEPKIAKNELSANPSAENDYEKSSYVNYTDANGNTILCRVLYNDEYGIDIISADVIKNNGATVFVPLGQDDSNVSAADFTYTGSATMKDAAKKGAASYNRSFVTLNEMAESYRNKTDEIAESSRCVGSPRDTTVNTLDASGYYTGQEAYMRKYSWNGLLRIADENYEADLLQMKNLNIVCVSAPYWLNSRFIVNNSNYTKFHMRNVRTDGPGWSYLEISILNGSKGTASQGFPRNGLRPIFHLSSGVKVIGGNGQEKTPYILGK